MLCRKNEKAYLFLFYLAGFFYKIINFVNNKKIFLHYFHKSEKHLERVGPELNLFPEYYNCMNVRLICFNDYITSIMFTRSSRYLSTGDTPYPHKRQRVSRVVTTPHTE